jgi:hypothetical protein
MDFLFFLCIQNDNQGSLSLFTYMAMAYEPKIATEMLFGDDSDVESKG